MIMPVVKWIGSKRNQANEIVQYFPNYINTYYEPFCGGCSVTYQFLSSLRQSGTCVNRIVCSDINGDLIDLWNTVKNDPKGLLQEYHVMWEAMNTYTDRRDKKKFYEDIRDDFNQTRSPYLFFFLMRTCTNGLPRYNKYGMFNQSFHITRSGMSVSTAKKLIDSWSDVFKRNNVYFMRCDYTQILNGVDDGDFLYLDPPYKITRSTGRYFGKIDCNDLFDRLRRLNYLDIKYALSFDSNSDGVEVPEDCYENKIILKSSRGGFRITTQRMSGEDMYESLYIN